MSDASRTCSLLCVAFAFCSLLFSCAPHVSEFDQILERTAYLNCYPDTEERTLISTEPRETRSSATEVRKIVHPKQGHPFHVTLSVPNLFARIEDRRSDIFFQGKDSLLLEADDMRHEAEGLKDSQRFYINRATYPRFRMEVEPPHIASTQEYPYESFFYSIFEGECMVMK